MPPSPPPEASHRGTGRTAGLRHRLPAGGEAVEQAPGMDPTRTLLSPDGLARRTLRRLARPVWGPVRRMLRRSGPRAGILMYHRIAEESLDPWGLCVPPDRFDEQMAVLAQTAAAVDLAAIGDGSALDRCGRSVAVTFDDGYADNLLAALPILEKHDVPATFFLVSQALGSNREYWWDALMRAVLESGPLPPVLALRLGGVERIFQLEEDHATPAPQHPWDAEEGARSGRERLYLGLWNAIVVLEPAEQEEAVEQVLAWAGCTPGGPPHRHAAQADAIAALAHHPLVRIGSHTRHHVSLPDCDPRRQRAEIEGAHRELEDLLGRRIDRFAYPYGRYDRCAREIVEALKIDLACTTVAGLATACSPRSELPRLHVQPHGGEGFARWLRDEHDLLAAR